MLSPSFIDLLTFTGECIDREPLRKYAQFVSDEVRKDQQGQIRRILRGEKPDYLPFAADLDWWFAERWHMGTLERDLEGVDLCSLGLLGRYMPNVNFYEVEYEPNSNIKQCVSWHGKPVEYTRGGYPGQERVIEVSTPLGNLTMAEKYVSHTFAVSEYPVKSVGHLKILRYILEHCRVIPLTNRCEKYSWGWGPKTPMQTFIVELAGITNTSFLMADVRHEMEETMNLIARIERKIYEIAAKSDIDVIGICENLSSEVSGGYFDRYIGPQLAEWSDLLHSHGKKFIIHMDGTLKPLLSHLQNVGVDLVNGVTAALGDVEPDHLRQMAGDRLILHDILPNSIFVPAAVSDSDFEEYVLKVILHFENDDRVILGIGDMLPINGSIKRVEKVVKMARELTGR